MSAAAFRFDLFPRQAEEHGSMAASAFSLALHGGIIAAAIWASAQVRPAVHKAPAENPIPIYIAGAAEATVTAARSAAGPSTPNPVSASSIPDPLNFAPILEGPMPAPGNHAGFVTPDIGSSVGTPVSVKSGEETIHRQGFAVSTSVPALRNAAEVQRALERNYPAMLRDAGVGGRVVVWLLIDERGRVMRAEVNQGSGQTALDNAAVNVGSIMRFTPALNRGDSVRIWVSLPIIFKTKN